MAPEFPIYKRADISLPPAQRHLVVVSLDSTPEPRSQSLDSELCDLSLFPPTSDKLSVKRRLQDSVSPAESLSNSPVAKHHRPSSAVTLMTSELSRVLDALTTTTAGLLNQISAASVTGKIYLPFFQDLILMPSLQSSMPVLIKTPYRQSSVFRVFSMISPQTVT